MKYPKDGQVTHQPTYQSLSLSIFLFKGFMISLFSSSAWPLVFGIFEASTHLLVEILQSLSTYVILVESSRRDQNT